MDGPGLDNHVSGGHATADNPSSSTLTRDLLGWTPVQAGLIDDLSQGHYFDIPATTPR